MNWLARLESKFGHIAIRGLLRYVAAFSSLCFVLVMVNRHYFEFLVLTREQLLNGEVWRLFTYLFIPMIGGIFPSWLGMALWVWFLFWMGDGLEEAWGAFRFNVFFLVGMVGTTLGVLIAGRDPVAGSGGIFYMTIFLAFARFYPETVIRLFFVLPVKVKWLAWLDGVILLLTFLSGTLAERLAVIAGLLNYLLFFGREIVSEAKMHREVSHRRARFEKQMRDGTEDTMHRCKVCGRTELTTPELEFRVAADGEEYCAEHLPKKESA
jgi:hypothetical protein